MSQISEILPKVFTWSEFSQEKQLNFNGHYLIRNQESVLIDPSELNTEGFAELRQFISAHSSVSLKAILLTNVHHDRMSQKLKGLLSIPVLINEKDRELLEFEPDDTFQDGQELFCGLKAIQFSDQKTPGETGFFHEKDKFLVVGDALIGRASGKVDLLPAEKYKDANRAKKGLEILKNLNFNTLLVGDGESILNEAKIRVLEFLKS